MLLLRLVEPASAHIEMEKPNPVTVDQKVGPCGDGPHVRGDDVAVFDPGQTITVKWHETVHHPGYYRISFDDDGDDSFEDPATPGDAYTNDTVLLDEIADEAGRAEYSVEVTLPDIECENCTLQLIQLMTDKPPYQPGTNDIYYQCADLALRIPEPPQDTDEPAEEDDDSQEDAGGCATTAPPTAMLLAAAWGWLVIRRRTPPAFA
jgi:uncharacterized protein (TIGR03382 family)